LVNTVPGHLLWLVHLLLRSKIVLLGNAEASEDILI